MSKLDHWRLVDTAFTYRPLEVYITSVEHQPACIKHKFVKNLNAEIEYKFYTDAINAVAARGDQPISVMDIEPHTYCLIHSVDSGLVFKTTQKPKFVWLANPVPVSKQQALGVFRFREEVGRLFRDEDERYQEVYPFVIEHVLANPAIAHEIAGVWFAFVNDESITGFTTGVMQKLFEDRLESALVRCGKVARYHQLMKDREQQDLTDELLGL